MSKKSKIRKSRLVKSRFLNPYGFFFIYSYKIRIDEKKLKIEKIKSISQKSEFFVLVEIHFYVLLFFFIYSLSSAEESDRMLEPDPRIVLRPMGRVEDA